VSEGRFLWPRRIKKIDRRKSDGVVKPVENQSKNQSKKWLKRFSAPKPQMIKWIKRDDIKMEANGTS